MKEILGINYYTIVETSELLGLGKRSIQQFIYDKKLEAIMVGDKWHITEESIKNYMTPSKNKEKSKRKRLKV